MPWDIPAVLAELKNKLKDRGYSADTISRHLTFHKAVLSALEKDYFPKFPSIRLQGLGGSGTVILLKASTQSTSDIDLADRCLKYPQPILDAKDTLPLAELLANEAKALQSLHHQYIMPVDSVFDLDLSNVEGISEYDAKVPGYVMPYIQADDLTSFAASSETFEPILQALYQLAQALDHLHQRNLVHLDVKPQNVMIRFESSNNEPSALLADFGFCKRINTSTSSDTLVLGTDGYVDPRLLALMPKRSSTNPNRIRDQVPRQKIQNSFDRYSFGATVLDSMCLFLKDHPTRTITTRILRGLQIVAVRCANGRAATMRDHPRYLDRLIVAPETLFDSHLAESISYNDTTELVDNMRVLVTGPNSSSLEAEVSDSTDVVTCLPPRSFAPFGARTKLAVDSGCVRRLANVSQLALCSHLYLGSRHTRQEHMVGTFRLVGRFLRHILRSPSDPTASLVLTLKHQRCALLGSLLHDMSHIPLMHDFEDSVPSLKQSHYTSAILAKHWGDDDFHSELDEVLAAWKITRTDLDEVIGGGVRRDPVEAGDPSDAYMVEFVASLIDSGVDADKIDYLTRDAHHLGVQFGAGLDTHRLERNLTMGVWAESKAGHRIRCALAATKKGETAAEATIEVRRGMYSQVYAHKTVRAARAMLNWVTWKWRSNRIQQGASEEELTDQLFEFASLLPRKAGQGTLLTKPSSQYAPTYRDKLPFAESRVVEWLASQSGDPTAQKLARNVIERRLYKLACELGESSAKGFLDRAYPKEKGTQARGATAFTADAWLELFDDLARNVKSFLEGRQTSTVTTPQDDLPPVIVDVAIPKTMRSQKELAIVADRMGRSISWRRLDTEKARFADSQEYIFGQHVRTSPVYTIYAGRSGGEDLTEIVVRLYARPDLASRLRSDLEGARFSNWLNAFKPTK